MGRKWLDLACKGAEYTDRDGKTKHKYQNVGKIAVEDDGRMWGILEIFGLERPFSVFEQKRDKGGSGGSGGGSGGGSSGGGSARGSGAASTRSGRDDLDDDIPF
jgi:uncharacterized membrane protein YgcG